MRRGILWVAAALVLAGPVSAQQRETVSAEDVEKRVKTVTTKIEWKRSLDSVKAAAAKSGKMIFWLQLVGELDDGL